jgi:exosortase B
MPWGAMPLLILGLGWGLMFGPTYAELSRTLWATDSNGHGPLILGVSAWLLWRARLALAALPRQPAGRRGVALFVVGVAMQVFGRAQALPSLEVAAQSVIVTALLLIYIGPRAVRLAWFPVVFLLFTVPWPQSWVDALTQPMKAAVSAAAVAVLHALDYPVGRAGVVVTAGPYQLLVADACAGLNSLFTLEALGMLYLNLMQYASVWRNVLLALAIAPLAFAANVVRVILLVLVTYHGGEAAGRGYAHDFAGMTLFLVALVLIYGTDRLFGMLGRPAPRLAL